MVMRGQEVPWGGPSGQPAGPLEGRPVTVTMVSMFIQLCWLSPLRVTPLYPRGTSPELGAFSRRGSILRDT